ncbi:hypothetical protein K504DRAFT_453281 [Pleomassaria siparia CBS 279.74]|uniref:Uncharacterized protein n=1 Tax=Pleomassaria siparia CBS 279.74 TaxID=1314801 RepID=A0A6G1KGF4_9PLEO|nr:hypothetical protein K504DRAFT_453281 [Pleomassaria siparia CBS 279.74]
MHRTMEQSATHSLSGDGSVEKYVLLTSQEEALRRRLSLQIPSNAPMTATSPEMQSLASSPTHSRSHSRSMSIHTSWAPEFQFPSSSNPIPTQPGMAHCGMANDTRVGESANHDEMDQRNKATLMELLNTESVRSDDKYRAWVQERLMDFEKKIRRQRRRRSSNPSGEELASSIAEHIDYHLSPFKTF